MGGLLLAAATGLGVYLPITMIALYLAAVLYIGIFAFRRGRATGEDFFLASRSVGPIVFFLSLFATNMTAVAILGSSGAAYKQGIGIFGMMATISALVIPLSLFVIGTRLWALGKRFGHMTQVAYFRDRWECSFIGTVIFGVSAFMLLPYLIVSIIGGGTILEALSHGVIPFWLGGAIVALVVMGNVFFGGMRGAVWVNVFQTLLFLSFGAIAFGVIGGHLPGGFTQTVERMAGSPAFKPLLTRERIPPMVFLSYCFIPLSSIMFPHMAIMCFTARKVTAFKKTVVLYPLCIMAIWLPCVFLGAIGPSQPKVANAVIATTEEIKPWVEGQAKDEPPLAKALAKAPAKSGGPALYARVKSGEIRDPEVFALALGEVKDEGVVAAKIAVTKNPRNSTDSVLLHMLAFNAPVWLAGLLAAGIISAVMGSDCHQILALSTMFSKDIFEYYGGHKRIGEKATVFFGRGFILIANSVAYVIALGRPAIFEIAVRYAFSGFASMAPVMVAALFWKRSTKYGALASTLWVAFCLTGQRILETHHAAGATIWGVGGCKVLSLNPIGSLNVGPFLPVVPMVIGSAVWMVVVSLVTKPPSRATIIKYFMEPAGAEAAPSAVCV
jgi:solute:Na+ symporter, SSS family